MAVRSHRCDSYRLRLSLDDRLSDSEQAELATHLEACAFCRQELERLAAASHLWGEARLLRDEAEPGALPTVGLAPGTSEAEGDETDLAADSNAWIQFLDPPDPDQPGTLGRLGPYQVFEVLGQGGMGVVLKARDPALDRTVAIKVLTPALAHGATARRRFAREARAAAAVGHEHIVAIHAVDEFRGLPYLVMQYIPGRSLQERLDASGPLEVKEILRVGTQAARALAAAHAQGVVHRDIKPANILLENCIERVKLTDFGLARAIDDASLTQSGIIAGTPQYMAPEQARGEPVDARSDLFSLGAVLYAMAGGRPPFRADSAMAVLKRVCDDRHRSIRELNPDVPDWLESVIDRLLAKDPADRFQTAAEVADLLERGLAHVQQPTAVPRPVVQGVPGPPLPNLEFDLPVSKTPRRPRRKLAVAASLALLALAGLGASEAAGLSQVTEFVATILRIKTPEGTLVVKVDDPGVKVDIDNEVVIIGGAGPQEIRLRTGLHRVHATRNGQPVRDELVSIMKGKKEIVAIGFEPTTTPTTSARTEPQPMTAPTSHAAQCMVCHQVSDTLTRPLPPTHPEFDAVILGAASAKRDSLLPGGIVHPAHARGLVWSLAYSPDGRRLAIGQQGLDGQASTLRVWDLSARKDSIWLARLSAYRCVAFSPDGKRLATGTFDCAVEMYQIAGDVATLDGFWRDLGEPINALAFLPDGWVVAGDWAGKIHFLNAASPARVPMAADPLSEGYAGKIFAVAASRDGSTLAVAGSIGDIDLYDVASRRKIATMKGHDSAVESLDFSPDGKHLASASWDKTVRVWEVPSGREARRIAHSAYERLAVRFSPDGKMLACSDGQHEIKHSEHNPGGVIQLWNWAEGTLLRVLRGHTNNIYALAFSPDGKTLASGSMDQTVKLWDTATGQLHETIVPGESGTSSGMGMSGRIGDMSEEIGSAIPPEATEIGYAIPIETTSDVGRDSPPLALPEVTFPQGDKEAWAAAYSPDGKTLITSGSSGSLLCWSLLTGGTDGYSNKSVPGWAVHKLPSDGSGLGKSTGANAIAFAPDGGLFATANSDHTIGLWGTDGNQSMTRRESRLQVIDLVGGVQPIIPYAKGQGGPGGFFYPPYDFRRFLSPLLCPCNQLAALTGHADSVRSVAFSPDGKRLASGSWDKTARVWDVQTRKLLSTLPAQSEPINAVAFSPDGKLLATGSGDWRTKNPGRVQIWDPATGNLRMPVLDARRDIKALAFSPDGKKLACANGASEGSVAVVSLSIGEQESTVGPVVGLDCPTGATAVAFSADGKILAAGQWNGKIRLWDASTLHPLTANPIPAHSDMIFDLAFSPDGKHIATAGKDGTVKIWKVADLTANGNEPHDRTTRSSSTGERSDAP